MKVKSFILIFQHVAMCCVEIIKNVLQTQTNAFAWTDLNETRTVSVFLKQVSLDAIIAVRPIRRNPE